MNYPKELFRAEQYRVCFSPEEHAALKAEGWRDERQAGAEYRVHTAIPEAAETPVANQYVSIPFPPDSFASVPAEGLPSGDPDPQGITLNQPIAETPQPKRKR